LKAKVPREPWLFLSFAGFRREAPRQALDLWPFRRANKSKGHLVRTLAFIGFPWLSRRRPKASLAATTNGQHGPR
jgi:hypothetical protein